MADPHEVLGVPPQASRREIVSAYRRLAKEFHPDLNDRPDANIRMKELNSAYEYLVGRLNRRSLDRHQAPVWDDFDIESDWGDEDDDDCSDVAWTSEAGVGTRWDGHLGAERLEGNSTSNSYWQNDHPPGWLTKTKDFAVFTVAAIVVLVHTALGFGIIAAMVAPIALLTWEWLTN